MGQVIQFPSIRLAPVPVAEPVVNTRSVQVMDIRTRYLKKCMDGLIQNPGSYEHERLLIWSADDFLRWFNK